MCWHCIAAFVKEIVSTNLIDKAAELTSKAQRYQTDFAMRCFNQSRCVCPGSEGPYSSWGKHQLQDIMIIFVWHVKLIKVICSLKDCEGGLGVSGVSGVWRKQH